MSRDFMEKYKRAKKKSTIRTKGLRKELKAKNGRSKVEKTDENDLEENSKEEKSDDEMIERKDNSQREPTPEVENPPNKKRKKIAN